MYTTVTQQYLYDILSHWSGKPLETALKMIETYVYPNEATLTALTWKKNGQWKRSTIYKEPVLHQFPLPHAAYIENTIDYKVPEDKMNDLAKFNGSLVIDHMKGEVSARSRHESLNRLTLNVMHDIVIGKRSLEDAIEFFIYQYRAFDEGFTSDYLTHLLFIDE
jgi:hypothetical protein